MLKVCCRGLHSTARRLKMVNWSESEILIDRKSKFQGRATNLQSAQDVEFLLEDLVSNDKSIQKATHKHMYAWRVGSEQKGKIVATNQGMSDCGESGAGISIMIILERAKLVNVLVIVTRWYGGTALGPARFRHISTTATESLRKGGFFSDGEEDQNKNDKKRSKKKK